jgi:hypothetical protein
MAMGKGDSTHHHDRSATKPTAKYFRKIRPMPTIRKNITPSGKGPIKPGKKL